MSVNVLEILSAIEKEGNFRKAAAALGVTQPYLSQVVQRLEKECRGLIVDRHHKPFKLTELGQYYLDTRRRIQNIEEETEQFCSDHANLRTGKLRIASNGERTNAILIPGVSAFAKQYPGIYIELTLEHHLEEISNLLLSGMAEVGVLFQYLLKKGLNAYPLFKERYLLRYPIHNTSPMSVNDITLKDVIRVFRMRILTSYQNYRFYRPFYTMREPLFYLK